MNTLESQKKLHQLGVPIQTEPDTNEEVYIVRISPTKKGPLNDYRIMKDEDHPAHLLWDADKDNRIQVGDWLGFILGDASDARVEIFQIHEIQSPSKRPPHWNLHQYTSQGVQKDVKKRNVLLFEKRDPIYVSWNQWKKEVKYKSNYMPRGTTRSRHIW